MNINIYIYLLFAYRESLTYIYPSLLIYIESVSLSHYFYICIFSFFYRSFYAIIRRNNSASLFVSCIIISPTCATYPIYDIIRSVDPSRVCE